jgi:GlpG protein
MAVRPQSEKLLVKFIQAEGLVKTNLFGDAFWCSCEVVKDGKTDRTRGCKSQAKSGTLEPVWKEDRDIKDWHQGESLQFTIYDQGFVAPKIIGHGLLNFDQFYPRPFEGPLPIVTCEAPGKTSGDHHGHVVLHVEVRAEHLPQSGVSKCVAGVFDSDGDGKVSFSEIVETVRREFGKVSIDAPIVLCFSAACLAVHVLTAHGLPDLTKDYFALWPWAYSSPWHFMFYPRLVSHVLGHGGWEHLMGNLTLIIVVGPACEVDYGPRMLSFIILVTALVTSIFHYIFAPKFAMLMGASGVAFMLIMLNSLRDHEAGKIRVSFMVLVALWVWKECVGFVSNNMFGHSDGVSHLAHMFGAIVGGFAGFFWNDRPAYERLRNFCRRLSLTLVSQQVSSQSSKAE